MQILARVLLCALAVFCQTNAVLHAQRPRPKIIVPTPPPKPTPPAKKPVSELPARYVGNFTQESSSQIERDTEIVTIKATNMTWVRATDEDWEPWLQNPVAIDQAIQAAGGMPIGGASGLITKWGLLSERGRGFQMYAPNGDGQITITVKGNVPGSGNNAGSCEYGGSKTYEIAALPDGATKYFMLMVAPSGRYWLNLAMMGNILSADYTFTCTNRRLTPRGDKKFGPIELALGFEGDIRMGVNADAPPRKSGPSTITGNWRFGGLDR